MTTATPPPDAGPTTWTPPPPPPPPPPRKGGISKGTGLAIVVIVIIVLVILALLLTGVIPGFKSSSSGSSSPSGKSYNVTFSESGLKTGTTWSVTLGSSTLSSSTAAIVFSEKNGTYTFTVGSVTGYAANPPTGSVTVAGAAVQKSIAFAVGYSVTFTESGLPSGTMWSVTLNGVPQSGTGASIVFTESNGTYSYTVGSVTGYTATPATGSVTVSGASQTVPITYSALPPGTYSVTFTESGLAPSTSWSVTLAGTPMSSTTATIVFSEKNGTYPYTVGAVAGYTASPTHDNVTVSGAAASASITFTKSSGFGGPAYPVTFAQTGLPSTIIWGADCVPLTGSTPYYFGEGNAGPTTEFAVPDGTYFCHIGTGNTSYVAVPANTNVTVAGGPVTVNVKFALLYTVNFNETGLALDAPWTVTLNGSEGFGSGGSNITFTEPNGTYPFTVSAFGYTASPASGSVTVNGATVTEVIAFTPMTTYTLTFTETGLAAGHYWYVDLENVSTGEALAGTSIVFHVPAGSYSFIDVYASTPSPPYYTATPSSGTITVTSHAVTQSITFTTLTTYAVEFTETGLALGATWAVELNETPGSAAAPSSITLDVPLGLNDYYVYAAGYTTPHPFANVTVTTGTNTVKIPFTAIPTVTTYNVTFNESGLPPFSDWEVDVANDGSFTCSVGSCFNYSFAGTPLNISLANGNYSWVAYTDTLNFTASPMAGALTVNGAAVSVNVTYVNSSADYLVGFAEGILGTGYLPNGTSWSVTLGGSTVTTEGMWVFFLEPNGTTKSYTITPPIGYVVLPSSGSVTGYYNASQGEEFAVGLSPYVWIVFAPTTAGPAVLNMVSSVHTGYMVAVTREL